MNLNNLYSKYPRSRKNVKTFIFPQTQFNEKKITNLLIRFLFIHYKYISEEDWELDF